jgi:hypothetical protein
MHRLMVLLSIAAVALAVAGTGQGVPGSGKNAVFIFNNCDHGIGQITLVSQASPNGLFATAHVVGSNRPAPLISLDYEVYSGTQLLESGGYAHAHPQQGQPIVTCNGTFSIGDLTFVIRVTGFFPAGS